MISATGTCNKRRREIVHSPRKARFPAGFTLLEVMVVLVLIGIIFGFAVLSFSGDDLAGTLEQETRRLMTLINLANDEAVMRGEDFAMRFTDDGYTFLMLRPDGWQEPENDRLLRARTLPAGISVAIEVEGELQDPDKIGNEKSGDEKSGDGKSGDEEHVSPQVFILSSGEMTPFAAIFSAEQSRYRYHLVVSQLGEQEWEVEEMF